MSPSARPARSRSARRPQSPRYACAAAMCDLALCTQAQRAIALCIRVRSVWAGISASASPRRPAAAHAWTTQSPTFPTLAIVLCCRRLPSLPSPVHRRAHIAGTCRTECVAHGRVHIAGTCRAECVAHACLLFVTAVSRTCIFVSLSKHYLRACRHADSGPRT